MAEIEYTASIKMRNMTCQQHLLVNYGACWEITEGQVYGWEWHLQRQLQDTEEKKKCGFMERFNPIPGVDEMSVYDIFLNSWNQLIFLYVYLSRL